MPQGIRAIAAGVTLLLPTTTQACTKTAFSPFRTSSSVFLIGTAIADTVHAGMGAVRPTAGKSTSRSVYGQLVSVEQLSDSTRAHIPAGTTQVVLVPWEYAEDCTPVPWTRSAAWLPTNIRGIIIAELRDRKQWARGIPTLDAFTPEAASYPDGAAFKIAHRPTLSIEQLFPLLDLLPEQKKQQDSSRVAAEPLFAWARSHQELAKLYPMSIAVRTARIHVQRSMVKAITSPLTGTYKFTVTFADREALTFFGRTSNIPMVAWGQVLLPPSPSGFLLPDKTDGTTVEPLFGYHLMVTVNPNLEALTAECTGKQLVRNSAYMAIVNEPASVVDGAQVMRGMLEVSLIERAFPDDTLYKGFAKKQVRAPAGSTTRDANARFTLGPNAKLHVEETVQLINGQQFVFRGERVAPDVLEKCIPR